MPKCKNTKCEDYRPGISEGECEYCVDGRDICVASEYISTCDGCGEPAMHETMRSNAEDLGFCEKCVAKMSPEELATLIEEEEM